MPKDMNIALTVCRPHPIAPTEATILDSDPDEIRWEHYKSSVDIDTQMSSHKAAGPHDDETQAQPER